MAFGADHCRFRVNNAVQNFAILRRIVMNLLRQDRTTNVGLKNRRMLTCTNVHYLVQLLDWKGIEHLNIHATALPG